MSILGEAAGALGGIVVSYQELACQHPRHATLIEGLDAYAKRALGQQQYVALHMPDHAAYQIRALQAQSPLGAPLRRQRCEYCETLLEKKSRCDSCGAPA